MELAAEIERQNATKRDFLAPSAQLCLSSNGESKLTITEKDIMPINDTAHEQIAAKLEIPKRYYDRMRSDSPREIGSA